MRVDQAALAAEALEQKRAAEKAKRKAVRKAAQQMAVRAEDEQLFMLPRQVDVMLKNHCYREEMAEQDEAREQRRLLMREEEVKEEMLKMGLIYRGIEGPAHTTGADRFYSC